MADREHVETKTFVDKSKWRAGQDEPDRVEWRYKGVPCMLRRGPLTGAWCGYAATSEGHPWYEQPEAAEEGVFVHGRVTYASACEDDICHVPRPGEPEHVFWIGFDCSHARDFSPAIDASLREGKLEFRHGSEDWLFQDCVYRDQAYAMAQAESVAEQILARAMR
jgi:hypothetical protein